MFVMVERGGAERIMGVSVAMPLGSARRRGAEFDVLYGTLGQVDDRASANGSGYVGEKRI